jgi:hypothetical protein
MSVRDLCHFLDVNYRLQDLLRRLLNAFSDLPPPSMPPISVDVALLDAANQLSSVPPSLFSDLAREPDFGGLCPLDDSAPDDIKILCARNLDMRLAVLRDRDRSAPSSPATPEIRLEESDELSQRQTTLHSSKMRTIGNAHQKHIAALLRLLYLHVSINSGNLSPYIVSLLVPLYVVLNQEVEPEELAHAEADTFWLFEAMVGEFVELEDKEGGNLWMKNFSQRLAWIDDDLFTDLVGHNVYVAFATDTDEILFCSKPRDWIPLCHIIHSNFLNLPMYMG